MTSGRFRIGETVFGYSTNARRTGRRPDFVFRICAPNHKDGPFNSPTNRYGRNPYANAGNIPANYSTSSTILNVDTFSLASQAQGQFFGQVSSNMILEGRSSRAQARVSDIRFITDTLGKLQGTLQIPDPDRQANPRWETGTKTFKFTTSNINSTWC